MPEPTWVEGASRWLANRSTRRSFLGRLGRTAVLVAAGSSVATLLVDDEAEARVCGQSGVSPKCPTYDCDDVWGWCWYATGCCAGGELKKICDCCRQDHPNVHGYCPSGTNVLCIVESCGADPRVQVVGLRRLPTDDPVALAAGISRAGRPDGGTAEVWFVDAGQPLLASVLAPSAARVGAAVLLVAGAGAGLGAAVIAEVQRLGASRAVLHGPGLGAAIEADARRYGLATTRASTEVDGLVASIVDLSRTLAQAALAGGVRRVVAVEPTGRSLEATSLAASFAAAKGYPLVVGVDVAKQLGATLTYLVGPEAAARAGEVPGGHAVFEAGDAELSTALFRLAYGTERAGAGTSVLVAASLARSAALAAGGTPVLVHADGALEGVRDALFAHRDRLRSVTLAGATGALSTDAYYELQSIVNGFEAHKLIGVSGQGLPVIDQPVAERPLGLARRSNTPPVELGPQYWTGRGLDLSEP